MLETAIAELPSGELPPENDDGVWIEALPARVYHTPQYGKVPITPDKLERMITSFRSNIRGQEIATDYEHGLDQAKGLQASGWYQDFEIRPSSSDPTQMSLYAKVKFTDDAKKDIKDGKYRYWSLEWDDEYMTDGGQVVPDVVIGGGLTNRPVAKRTMPINFSEKMWDDLSDEDKKYAARIIAEQKALSENEAKAAFELLTSRGFNVALSEAAMEHSDPGIAAPIYEADDQPDPGTGQPVPRVTGDPSKNDPAIAGGWRWEPLPVVNPKEEGDPIAEQESREHTNVQMSEITDLRSAASALESFISSEKGETPPDNADAQEAQALLTRVRALLDKEGKETEGNNNRKAASELVNEVKTFARSKGGKSVKFSEDQITKLKELGFEVPTDDDASADDFIADVERQFSELKQFKDAVGGSAKEKQFAEMFPQQYKEHQELLATNRANSAKSFAESHSRINRVVGTEGDTVKTEPTRNGLSALAIEAVTNAHTKFSEGNGTVGDLEEVVKTITNGGVVEFGEVGSGQEPEPIVVDGTTAQGIAAARKLFAEKVNEVQVQHAKDNNGEQIDVIAATHKASAMYPDLAEAYRATAA